MSQVISSSFAAPGEPRPPVIGEEACHARGEGGERVVKRATLTMETKDGVDDYPKPRSGWEGYGGGGGGGAEGGPSPSYTAASTPPYLRWAGGLRSLLDDKEGVEHFKTYLKEEDCPEMLNFWFACEGLRHQTPERADHDPDQFRRLIVAMYKRFVRPRRHARAERQPAELPLSEDVRSEIAERVRSGRLDGRVFDAAQAQVEAQMNRTVYPNFLKSDYYIQLVQGSPAGGHDGADESLEGSSCASSVCGPPPPAGLPTLHEEHEPSGPPPPAAAAAAAAGAQPVALLTRGALLATQDNRARDVIQPIGRRKPDKGAGLSYQPPGLPLARPVNPYHTLYSSYNPVSRQDSELQSMSSEALTDDTNSRAGSSIDGRLGHYPTGQSQKRVMKRQLRMMKDSARQNQEAVLQHTVIPRTQRPAMPCPDPTRNVDEFARLLSSKLEQVILEREMMESGADSKRLLQDAIGKLGKLAVENEQEILDAHISKVFDSSHQTPARSGARSPPRPAGQRRERDVLSTLSADSGNVCDLAASQLSLEQRLQRHHLPKSRTFPDYGAVSGAESTSHRSSREPARRSRQSLLDPDSGVSVVSADMLPARTRPADKVLMWMQQAEKDEAAGGRHRRPPSAGRRPPPPPPQYNTSRSGSLDRAAEDERRGRTRLSDSQLQAAPFSSLKRHARPPKPSQARTDPDEMLCIAYTFCGEEVPYMTRVAARHITLKQFKQLMPRKGNYRYFFKTECGDFETGVIQEEVTDDAATLPLWEGKVHGQVMSRD